MFPVSKLLFTLRKTDENGIGPLSEELQHSKQLSYGMALMSILCFGTRRYNNLNLLGYDHLAIKSGGGSVLYGSGAIGGTIHLNNTLRFNEGLKMNCLQNMALTKPIILL